MTSLLSCPNDQLVGKGLFEIGLLPDNVANRKMFQRLKRQPEVRYENLLVESRDGRHQEVEVVANRYQEDGHAVIQCNIRDITMRKRAEDILRRNEALFAALIEQAPAVSASGQPQGPARFQKHPPVDWPGFF
jgi:PAS domain-containing protein